jgi:hypothetical protein
VANYVDAATIESVTELSGSEDTNVEAATIGTKTTLIITYAAETYIVNTSDYDWNAWAVTYNYDSTYPIYGCVGGNDNDKGILLGT